MRPRGINRALSDSIQSESALAAAIRRRSTAERTDARSPGCRPRPAWQRARCRRRGFSLRLDVGRPNNLGPLLGLVSDELAKVGGGAWHHRCAKVGQPRLDLGIGEARVDLTIE